MDPSRIVELALTTYGPVTGALLLVAGILAVWWGAHRLTNPGKNVSVLFGLVAYTKKSFGEASVGKRVDLLRGAGSDGSVDIEPGKLDTLKTAMSRHRDGLTVGAVVAGTASVVAATLLRAGPSWIMGFMAITLIMIQVLQRADTSVAVSQVRDKVIELGGTWYETLYSERERHFVEEKEVLAASVVEDILPKLIDQIDRTHRGRELLLILDSGTTITPVFEKLMEFGVRSMSGPHDVRVATNNLAGIEAVQRLVVRPGRKLSESRFTLLGGQPLSTYRATTGDATEDALRALLDGKPDEAAPVSIGVVTANWLLVGQNCDSLSLCARGDGHAEFKELVVERADYVLVVVPLGKCLCVSDVGRLNDLIAEPPSLYRAVPLDHREKGRTFLVSTKRAPHVVTPLRNLSARLFGPHQSLTFEDPVEFEPRGSPDVVRKIELPHPRTRKHTEELFGESPPRSDGPRSASPE